MELLKLMGGTPICGNEVAKSIIFEQSHVELHCPEFRFHMTLFEKY